MVTAAVVPQSRQASIPEGRWRGVARGNRTRARARVAAGGTGSKRETCVRGVVFRAAQAHQESGRPHQEWRRAFKRDTNRNNGSGLRGKTRFSADFSRRDGRRRRATESDSSGRTDDSRPNGVVARFRSDSCGLASLRRAFRRVAAGKNGRARQSALRSKATGWAFRSPHAVGVALERRAAAPPRGRAGPRGPQHFPRPFSLSVVKRVLGDCGRVHRSAQPGEKLERDTAGLRWQDTTHFGRSPKTEVPGFFYWLTAGLSKRH